MNDQRILEHILRECENNQNLSDRAKREYVALVQRVSEDGLSVEFPLENVDDEQENALSELRRAKLIRTELLYRGSDGHFIDVDLESDWFKHLKNNSQFRPDTENREVFSTGAVRDTAGGKPRPDLFSAFAMERIGDVLRQGSLKYGERNYEAGIPISRCLASLHRHLMKFQQHVEDGEDHMASVVCNAMFILHYLELIKRGVLPEELDDLPKYQSIPGVHSNGNEPYDHE